MEQNYFSYDVSCRFFIIRDLIMVFGNIAYKELCNK